MMLRSKGIPCFLDCGIEQPYFERHAQRPIFTHSILFLLFDNGQGSTQDDHYLQHLILSFQFYKENFHFVSLYIVFLS